MNTDFPDAVEDFAAAARRRFAALGGVDLARRAETDPDTRTGRFAALTVLGAGDLDVRGDVDDLLAATQLCRAAGAFALPWPVIDDLLAVDGTRTALIDPGAPRVDHGGLGGGWRGLDLDGGVHDLELGPASAGRLGPFLTRARAVPTDTEIAPDDVDLHLVLGSWRILGTLEAAFGLVVDHVRSRVQFDQPLAQFQSVRFATADASVQLRGIEELAKFTTWRRAVSAPAQRHVDSLALRLYVVERAVGVLRTCHQLLGAVGFCDEHDVSVHDRHVQPLLRIPASAEALAVRLVPAVRVGEYEALFA